MYISFAFSIKKSSSLTRIVHVMLSIFLWSHISVASKLLLSCEKIDPFNTTYEVSNLLFFLNNKNTTDGAYG